MMNVKVVCFYRITRKGGKKMDRDGGNFYVMTPALINDKSSLVTERQ